MARLVRALAGNPAVSGAALAGPQPAVEEKGGVSAASTEESSDVTVAGERSPVVVRCPDLGARTPVSGRLLQ